MKTQSSGVEFTVRLNAEFTIIGKRGSHTDSRNVRFNIPISEEDSMVAGPIIEDIKKELACLSRTDSDWESVVAKIQPDDLRRWVASLAWWNYCGKNNTWLYGEMINYNFDHTHTKEELEDQLKLSGFSSKTSSKLMSKLQDVYAMVEKNIIGKSKTIKRLAKSLPASASIKKIGNASFK